MNLIIHDMFYISSIADFESLPDRGNLGTGENITQPAPWLVGDIWPRQRKSFRCEYENSLPPHRLV